jgi:ABC-2 type transport system ATP-binding protein
VTPNPARTVTSQGPPAIAITTVSKTYPVPFARARQMLRMKVPEPVDALRGVSFDVSEGEIFGLIGRNGAGKTTLTKIIATLVQPTTGHVRVHGVDSVARDQQVRAQIGLATAEERSFYWRLTVEQNLMFFARLYGLSVSRARRRLDDLIARLQLADLRKRRFGELSTGNKQRMAIARALLNEPPVLLLDEPTRSLDPLAAAQMHELIGSLPHGPRPTTILLTSHNLAEVEALCDRVAIISRGQIRAIDTPDHLRAAHHQHERVHVTVRGLTAGAAAGALRGLPDEVEAAWEGDHVGLAFTREIGDDALDRVVRALTGAGARIVSCETERGTLLDVLETVEREPGSGLAAAGRRA